MKNLKKINSTIFTILFIFILSSQSLAQNVTVYYDSQNNTFDNNQALAAEKYLQIHGRISKEIKLVKVELIKNVKTEKLKHSAIWKRPFGNTSEEFVVNFNRKLQTDDKVDFQIKYYRSSNIQEIKELKENLNLYVANYINQTFTTKKKKLQFNKSDKQIIKELDQIVAQQLKRFENRNNMGFEGFSEIIKSKLSQIRKTNLNDSKFLFSKTEDKTENKTKLKESLINELNELMAIELMAIVNQDLLVLDERNTIEKYPTEQNKKSLTLSAGYGVVYLGQDKNNTVSVGHAPYIGFSIPFSKSKINHKFARNLSFDAGVFILNMKNANGDVLSGPIIKRPVYFGLGYKFFKIIKIQAGYSVLEYQNNNNQFINVQNVVARPYIGLGVQFNLSMDFK